MKKAISQYVSMPFLILLAACGGTTTPQATNDTTAPTTPKNLTASGHVSFDNSNNTTSYVSLSWTGNQEPDLKGYTLYYGTDQNNLNQQKFYSSASEEFLQIGSLANGLRLQASNEFPAIQLKDLTINSTYFFALEAEDTSGNRSAKTSLVSAKMLDPMFPKAISSVPVFAAKDVALTLPEIKFTFNEAIKTDTFNVSVNCGGINECGTDLVTLLGNPTWNQSNTVVTYVPKKLKPSTRYSLQISGTDLDGNTFNPQQSSLEFNTIKGPTVTKYTPKSNFALGTFPGDSKIVLTFSEAMKKATVEDVFRVRIGTSTKPGTLSWNTGCVDNTSSNCTEMTFTPTTRYPYSSVVTWSLGSSEVRSFQDDYALEFANGSFNVELQLQTQP